MASKNRFMKNTALITGASSGIGRDFAHIHASKKGDLVITARREDQLNELKSELESKYGVKVIVIAKDLGLPAAPKEIYDDITSQGINIDILINNAGFGGVGKFHEREWEKDAQMIDLNVRALTELSRRFLPEFVKRKSGMILNVASTAALLPGPMQAVYFATKAYVRSFSLAIASELQGTGVTVTALLPGATATEFGSTSGMDKTPMFSKPFASMDVAKKGYDAMIQGKLETKAGLTFVQKMMMAFLPFTPMKIKLSQVKSMQQTTK
jgi:short-subunit dehydrogenase